MMRARPILILSFVLILSFLLITEATFTNPSIPPSNACGGFTASCVQCHGGIDNTGPGTLTVSINAQGGKYTHGNSYDVTVSITESGISRFGFESSVVDSALEKKVGTMSLINAANTSLQGGTRQFVGHKNAASNNTWKYKWKAPATIGTGTVIIYTAGMAANNDGNETGDHIYTHELTIPESVNTGIDDAQAHNHEVSVVNPVNENNIYMTLYLNKVEPVNVSLYNLSGQELQTIYKANCPAGVHSITSGLHPSISKGVYLLCTRVGDETSVKKIFVD